jgi:branched-chain amino acid transport system ATP-binding protein
MRALSGGALVSQGSIMAFGESVGNVAPWKLARFGVAHVPEGRRMFQGMSVYDSLRVACRASRGKLAERLEGAIEIFPVLGSRLKQRTETLSGGEQQMVAIARGLMTAPRLLLLDEPSQGLAPVMVEQVMEGVRRFVADRSRTVIIVEQRPEFLEGMMDAAVVVAGGQVSRRLTETEVLRGRALSEALLNGRLDPSLLAEQLGDSREMRAV